MDEELAMKKMGILNAFVAAVLAASPVFALGQYDPTLNPNPGPMNPQSPQNQNIPINQPGYPTQTGGTQANINTSMRDSLGAPGLTGQQMRDQRFVSNATEGGIADIKLSELALQKGSPVVKELAQKMIDDHTGINRDLSTVADSIGVILPRKMSKEQQAEYDKLNRLSGKDFDTEYVTYMAHSHFDDLHVFHMEAASAADENLQQEVVRALRTMHDHLGLIRDTAKNEGITLPEPPQRGRRQNPTAATR
jgi:putative membrane protein